MGSLKNEEEMVNLNGSVIILYTKCECLGSARHVFDEMHERNVVSWTVMISGYSQRGHGIPPHIDPFFEFVSKSGTGDDAIAFLNSMTTKKFPSISVALHLFKALFKAQRHDEAQDFLSKCPIYIQNRADVLNLFCSKKFSKDTTTTTVSVLHVKAFELKFKTWNGVRFQNPIRGNRIGAVENCLESSKVWVGELNEASGFRVRLDGERMSNIPHEAVSNILQLPSSDGVLGGNEFMTFNTTSNQAGETHEPLEQDVQEQYAIAAPSLNYENASLIVDGGLQSTNKRRKISSLWDKFDKHWGENGEVGATFKHCKKMYRAESKRGTSNLHKHLRKCLPSREDEAEQQPLIFETAGSSTSVIQRNSVINQERSRLDIETMIINHGYPLDMVQHEFELHSKNDVEANDLALFRQEKEKLIKYFDSLSCLLSLTLELWSSNDKMLTYCCLTVHFIDDGWQLKKKILRMMKECQASHVKFFLAISGCTPSWTDVIFITSDDLEITVDTRIAKKH
ncbi:hypothetical protein DKX38_023562 [Salix brachista]|uniref:BED-type domain-containing protein n=1 Tax=Salix brachista TaxID=2182728 RepID=A0A5N5JPL2_9ROSI|nr:hypothetical protein DKX38_023562 [Salix brachista]